MNPLDYIHHPGEAKSPVTTNLPLPTSLFILILKMLFAKKARATGPAAPQLLPGRALLLPPPAPALLMALWLNQNPTRHRAVSLPPSAHPSDTHTVRQWQLVPDVSNEFPAPESKKDPHIWEECHSERREEPKPAAAA